MLAGGVGAYDLPVVGEFAIDPTDPYGCPGTRWEPILYPSQIELKEPVETVPPEQPYIDF